MLPFFLKYHIVKELDVSSKKMSFLISNKSNYGKSELDKIEVDFSIVLFFMFTNTGSRLKATVLTRKGWFFKYDSPVAEEKIKTLSIKIGYERVMLIRRWTSFVILFGALLCYSISYLTVDVVSVAFFIAGNSYVIALLVYFYKSSTYLNWASEANGP